MGLPLDRTGEFCRRWKIERLELFGSALRSDFRPDSDLDFLYTFAEDAKVGWDLVTLADELSEIVGRPVDLVSRRAVEASQNPMRKAAIPGGTIVVYGS